MTCKVCKKQYTAKTVKDRKFLGVKRLNKNLCTLLERIIKAHVSICLIDETDPSNPYKKEYYWMRSLKTTTPFGLNTEETC